MTEPGLDSLMRMVQNVLDVQKDIREDMREIKARLGRVETDVAQLHVYLADQSMRLDRFSDRLERVEPTAGNRRAAVGWGESRRLG